MRRCLLLLICLLASTAMGIGAAKTKVRLFSSVEVARPGETVLVGVQMKMAHGWHSYWKHPGAAGLGTEIKWSLPDGITAGETLWPVPEKYPSPIDDIDLTTYVYHDEVMLLVPLTISETMPPGEVVLKATVDWQECESDGLCVLGDGRVQGMIVIGSETKLSEHAERLKEWQ